MSLHEVSSILWRERQLLELLLFKLEEEQLLLSAGRSRWLPHAAREVETVLEGIKQAELARSMEVDAAATELGLRPGPSLRELIEAAPAPWAQILGDHRDAFLAATHEIVAVAKTNRELLTAGQQAVHDALSWLVGPGDDAYAASGARAPRAPGPLMVDQTI